MKNKISLLLLLGTLSLIRPLQADTVVVAEATGTVEVYLASGTQVSSTYVSPMTGLAVGNSIAVRWGAFLGGFTPTISNPSAWFSSANFVGVNGFLNVGGSSAGRLSASITAGDANAISSYVLGDTGVAGTGLSQTLAAGSQLYAIIWNAPFVSASSGGNTFYPSSSSLQAAVLTNPNWIMPVTQGSTTVATNFSLSTGTTAIVGALDLANKGVTLAVIPEPSSMSLVVMGLIGSVAFRRKLLAKSEKRD